MQINLPGRLGDVADFHDFEQRYEDFISLILNDKMARFRKWETLECVPGPN